MGEEAHGRRRSCCQGEVRLSSRGYRLGLLPEGNREPQKACEQERAGVSTCAGAHTLSEDQWG